MKSKYLLVFAGLLLAASCNQVGSQQKAEIENQTAGTPTPTVVATQAVEGAKITPTPTAAAQAALAGLGSDKYASGVLPLGDYKYVTAGPKKGYVYLCRAQNGGGGAQTNGSWITGSTWNINKKINVQGSVSWPSASINVKISGNNRVITTNDLPTDHTTGTYPVSSSDPAAQVDRNPNTIKAQNFTFSLPFSPTQTSTPNCIGGEVGVMLDGVVLFNAFDAEGRDAAAHEVQDSCQAHPQESGVYHYHSLSSCIKNATVNNVIGYAFDGFPITGPKISDNKFLTTSDLDECHGLTSEIVLDGKKTSTYHYVMTEDFPYSVSCFKGKNTLTGPLGGAPNRGGGQTSGQNNNQQPGSSTGSGPSAGGTPPQAALDACAGKTSGSSCSFAAQIGQITGTCQTPPNQTSLACVPTR